MRQLTPWPPPLGPLLNVLFRVYVNYFRPCFNLKFCTTSYKRWPVNTALSHVPKCSKKQELLPPYLQKKKKGCLDIFQTGSVVHIRYDRSAAANSADTRNIITRRPCPELIKQSRSKDKTKPVPDCVRETVWKTRHVENKLTSHAFTLEKHELLLGSEETGES